MSEHAPAHPAPSPALASAQAAIEAVEQAADSPIEEQVALLSAAQRALAELLADEPDASPPQP